MTAPVRTPPLLDVRDLSIAYGAGTTLVDNISFAIERGQTVGLVGESGCGKSLSALAVMGLLSDNLRTVGGSIAFEGVDLTKATQRTLRDLRGNRMGMVFQEPLTALNPVMTVGAQIVEVLRAHRPLSKAQAEQRAVELLEMVSIPDPVSKLKEYPHRLSGGMRQRVVIAMAIACNPALLIADEPTTALDVTIQAQILDLLKSLQREHSLGLLLITHDLGVVRQIADRIVVMYAGTIVEEGEVNAVLGNPQHPYTAGLLAARPHGSYTATGHRLADIRGAVPPPNDRPAGCLFAPRCGQALARCSREVPARHDVSAGHAVRCYNPVASTGPNHA
jgi:oligopeptide/dipeptide ABC transporter ATP-binding protein